MMNPEMAESVREVLDHEHAPDAPAAGLQQLVGLLALDDDRRRWTATAALAELGFAALEAVLAGIATRPMGERLRQSYLYILEHQADTTAMILVRPVLAALHRPVYRMTAPLLAFHCLQLWRHGPPAPASALSRNRAAEA